MPIRNLELQVRDVQGNLIVDPAVFVRLVAVSGSTAVARVELNGRPVAIRFDGPAGANLVIRVSPSRYRDGAVQAQVDGDGRIQPAGAIQLPRRPDAWSPVFTPWAALASEFDSLKQLLRDSTEFRLGRDSNPGQVVEHGYDAIAPDDESRVLAKMCLLNLCARLRDEDLPGSATAWIDEVEQLLLASRERVFAEVSRTFFNGVKRLSERSDAGYRRSNPENHRSNLEKVPGVQRVEAIFSVKTREAKANLQLTVGQVRRNGKAVFLLDADLDEEGRLLGHTFEVIRHIITKGATHPLDIHEALRLKFSSLALGYLLEPRVPVGEVTARVVASAVAPAAPILVPRTANGFSPKRIVVLGDSVPWGQGLLHAQKMTTLVANAYAVGGTPADTHMLAHSGAIIGVGASPGRDVCDGEVPKGRPTILQQVKGYPKHEAAAVDVVILNGGVNDVDLRVILSPAISTTTLADKTARACGADLLELLDESLKRFPAARIAVLTYYPFLSRQSRFSHGFQFLTTMGAAPAPMLGDGPAWATSLWNKILDNCRTFHVASTDAIAKAVATANAQAGGPRCVVVDPEFRDEHAALAPHARLFGIGWDLLPQDPVAHQRRLACDRCEQDLFRRQQCYRASAGHPNALGAEAYARAIVTALP